MSTSKITKKSVQESNKSLNQEQPLESLNNSLANNVMGGMVAYPRIYPDPWGPWDPWNPNSGCDVCGFGGFDPRLD
jgi:hypothetical protein